MKVLIIYAHPERESFTYEVLRAFTAGLEESGHTVEVIDLYEIGFNPLTTRSEVYGEDIPEDVAEQQKIVSSAEAMAFIASTWWNGFPAILRGWIDRVFSYGFAYTASENYLGTKGLLPHKKVTIIQFINSSEEDKSQAGMLHSLEQVNIANFTEICGIPLVEQHFFFNHPQYLNEEKKREYLQKAFLLGKEFDKDLTW